MKYNRKDAELALQRAQAFAEQDWPPEFLGTNDLISRSGWGGEPLDQNATVLLLCMIAAMGMDP